MSWLTLLGIILAVIFILGTLALERQAKAERAAARDRLADDVENQGGPS